MREEIARDDRHVVGVAFDGDADRALFVDETGARSRGDHVMLALARELHRRGELPRRHRGRHRDEQHRASRSALERDGMRLVRAAVGDRYVLEAMRAGGYRLGGEQSGHVIDLDPRHHRRRADDARSRSSRWPARRARRCTSSPPGSTVYPQVLVNVRVADKRVAEHPAVREAVAAAERALRGEGRINVRPSGTEPLVRVMVETSDAGRTRAIAEAVADAIRALSA